MEKPTWAHLAHTAVCLFLLAGCAADRSVLQVNLPPLSIAPQSNGKSVVIRSVSDKRGFEKEPGLPDTPSLAFGGQGGASSPDLRMRAVGERRNARGEASGDILLSDAQTVASVIREALHIAFTDLGYTVLSESAPADADALVVDVEIYRFWAYQTPGFWTTTLHTGISTSLTIRIPDEDLETFRDVSVDCAAGYHLDSDGNWRDAMDNALKAYVVEAERVLPR